MLRPALFESMKPMFFDNSFDRLFDTVFTDFGRDTMKHMQNFTTDIIDKGDHYLLQAELPGFQKEDINIDLQDDILTISATHSEMNKEKEDEKHSYICKERRYSSYQRSFFVDGITSTDIDASYKNGILEVCFPKKEIAAAEEPKRIEVK